MDKTVLLDKWYSIEFIDKYYNIYRLITIQNYQNHRRTIHKETAYISRIITELYQMVVLTRRLTVVTVNTTNTCANAKRALSKLVKENSVYL